MPIFWLSKEHIAFPDPALADKEGVLAIGGDLSAERLLAAYRKGIFPWFGPGEPILWWSPDPRAVLFPDELKVARSMRPYLNQGKFGLSLDTAFETVMRQCGATRRATWISEDMLSAYSQLHEMGYAHSVEVWEGEALVGGLYGLALGKIFYGESMFTKVSNASKYGFILLVRELQKRGFWMIDCQQQTRHLSSLGARPIPRKAFMEYLRRNEQQESFRGNWAGWLEEENSNGQ